MTIREHAGELIVLRCWCGIQHAVPKSLREEQMRQHNNGGRNVRSIYCPLGHTYAPIGTSKADRLEKQLARERAAHDQTRADRDHAESRRRAEKAAKTKLKKRITNGVCPCCKRSFQNVARHIAHMHPGYQQEASEE